MRTAWPGLGFFDHAVDAQRALSARPAPCPWITADSVQSYPVASKLPVCLNGSKLAVGKTNMSDTSDGLNRRNLLTHGSVLAGCVGAAVTLPVSAGKAAPSLQTAAATPEETPNLNPPVVQVRAGKLRGFRDGRT